MRLRSKLALSAAALVAAFVVALVAIPYLFRDRIASRLKAEIARSVDARVDWGGVGLSLLRDFPNVTLSLRDLSVAGVGRFEGDTLAAVRHFRLVLDLGSVLRNMRRGEAIVVREVELRQPTVRLRVLEDGTANWDIVRESETETPSEARPLALSLRELRIHGGIVTLDDRQTDLAASLVGVEQSLRGDFAQEQFTLASRTRADTVSVRFAGVPYLSRVALALDADVAADLRRRRFTFSDDSLRLNDLVLAFSGAVTLGEPNVGLDLAFSAPSTDFGELLSLVPAIYARDFARLRTTGRMAASGRVQGEYGPNAFPALALRVEVENGGFQYPDLPLPARDVFVDLAVSNPGGHVDSTVVALERFHAVIGRRAVDASVTMRTPVSDPDVDLRVKGSVDLADVARTVKLEGVHALSGLVSADVAMRTRRSWAQAGQYDRISASGSVGIAQLAVRTATLPHPIAIDTARLRLTPRTAELTAFTGRIGSSDVRATGSLDNLLGFALRDEELRGRASVRSSHFDLDEWRSEDESSEVIPVPPNVDFTLDAAADRVTYGTLAISNARGALRIKDQRVTLDDFRMEMLRGSVVASGYYETTDPARPTFDLDLGVTSLDLPTAFAALGTMQKLAPVARWAQGNVSAHLKLAGALGPDMVPVYQALTGRGSFETGRLALQGAPVLGKLADVLALEQLRNPAIEAVRSSFEILDGRLHVRPFNASVGKLAVTVAGSNGIDQTLAYDLALAVPRAELGAAANQAVLRLASQAGRAGLDLDAAETIELGAKITGTITDPTIKPSFSGVAGSVREAAREAVVSRLAEVEARVDSTAEEARRRARAEAERLVAEAEQRAAAIRAEARTLAETVRREGNERADALLAKATSPAARMAAQVGADRIRKEADEQAERIVREADARADALVAEARQRADSLVPAGG